MIVAGAARPHLAESQNVRIEAVRRGAVHQMDAHVKRVIGNTRIRHELTEVPAVNRPGQILHELHRVAIGVLDREAEVAVGAGSDLSRDVDTFTGKIIAQPAGVGGFKADVDEAVFLLVLELW